MINFRNILWQVRKITKINRLKIKMGTQINIFDDELIDNDNVNINQ